MISILKNIVYNIQYQGPPTDPHKTRPPGKQLMCIDPKDRPSADEALEHPWLDEGGLAFASMVRMYVCVYMCVYTHTQKRTQKTYTYRYTNTYRYIYMYIYICLHTRVPVWYMCIDSPNGLYTCVCNVCMYVSMYVCMHVCV